MNEFFEAASQFLDAHPVISTVLSISELLLIWFLLNRIIVAQIRENMPTMLSGTTKIETQQVELSCLKLYLNRRFGLFIRPDLEKETEMVVETLNGPRVVSCSYCVGDGLKQCGEAAHPSKWFTDSSVAIVPPDAITNSFSSLLASDGEKPSSQISTRSEGSLVA